MPNASAQTRVYQNFEELVENAKAELLAIDVKDRLGAWSAIMVGAWTLNAVATTWLQWCSQPALLAETPSAVASEYHARLRHAALQLTDDLLYAWRKIRPTVKRLEGGEK